MLRSDCSDNLHLCNMAHVCTLLNAVVGEIRWDERFLPHNDNHYFNTHFNDNMPICSIGESLSDVLFNPKYVGHVYKIEYSMDIRS